MNRQGSSNDSPPIWVPLALLLGLSALFRMTQLDLSLQRLFWSPTDGWWLGKDPLIQFLYHYGTWPAVLVGVAAAAIWAASLVTGRWQRARPLSLFLALVLIIGPGVLVNAIFKSHFGRSRPVQAIEFGGNQPFRPLGETGPKQGTSFPSGHASTGFYWLALFVYFWKRRRAWAWGFGALGIGHGLLMGFGRMAQGSHWASDVLWAGGFVYLTAWLLNNFLVRSLGTPRDGVFRETQPVADSAFGNKVAAVFDDMVDRSVPFNHEMQSFLVSTEDKSTGFRTLDLVQRIN